ACSRLPFAEDLAALPRPRGEHRKAVDGGVQPEEMLEHTGEQKHAGAFELVLVELQLDASTTRERGALRARNARVVRPSSNFDQAVDVLPTAPRRRLVRVVKTEHRLERVEPTVGERHIVQRKQRDQTPELSFAERML